MYVSEIKHLSIWHIKKPNKDINSESKEKRCAVMRSYFKYKDCENVHTATSTLYHYSLPGMTRVWLVRHTKDHTT